MNANLQENIAPPKGQVVEATDLKERAEKLSSLLLSDEMPDYDKNIIIRAMEEFCNYSDKMTEIRDLPKVTIFGGARIEKGSAEYRLAKEIGEIMSNVGYKVITGAGPGIMEAGHEGATTKNSVGYAVELPFEEATNGYVSKSKYLVNCKYLFTRKVMLLREADAVVCVGPGFGTMDELFEILTLIKTGKNIPIPVVLLEDESNPIWTKFLEFCKVLEQANTISHQDLYLFRICQNAEDAADYINNFYKRYHSIRYVGDRLVIRLKTPLPEELYKSICEEYEEFIGEWGLVYTDALPEESDEKDIIALPRLVMKENRKDPVGLYRLIRSLNRDVDTTSTKRQDR